MNTRVQEAINGQIAKEASSSYYYLAMASWAENQGLNGTAKFLYAQSDEERFHMLKLIKFINERGGKAVIPTITTQPPSEFDSLEKVFELLLVTLNTCVPSAVYSLNPLLDWLTCKFILPVN